MSLLERIDRLLKSDLAAARRAELLGEKACYLARAGEFEASDIVIQEMRSVWGGGSDVRAIVWIMLAEGLREYFNHLSDEAWDRIRRASTIARAAKLERLYPLALSWLAHIEFFRADYESMGRSLLECQGAPGADSDDVQLRMSMIFADATMYSGDHKGAQYWYEQARNLAVRSADRVAIGALIYNRSMFGLSRVLLDSALDASRANQELLQRYELELRSAEAFDAASGTGVFTNQIQINLARARISRGEYLSARNSLLLIRNFDGRSSRTIGSVVADLALCAAGLGEAAAANELVADFLSGGFIELDVDEQVLALSSALSAAKLSGHNGLSSEVAKHLNVASELLVREMFELSKSLRIAAG